MAEDAPEVDCELVDLTEVSLANLRTAEDTLLARSVQRVLSEASDPATRSARMNNAGNDCAGSHLPELPDVAAEVPLITC